MKKKYKSQIILITTLSLVIVLGIVYIALIPILNLLKSIKETSDYYQAVGLANTGLEISYFTILNPGFDPLINTTTICNNITTRRDGVCDIDIINNNLLNRTSKYCQFSNLGYLNLQTLTTTQISSTIWKTNINSQGISNNKLFNIRVYMGAVCY